MFPLKLFAVLRFMEVRYCLFQGWGLMGPNSAGNTLVSAPSQLQAKQILAFFNLLLNLPYLTGYTFTSNVTNSLKVPPSHKSRPQ